MTSSATLEELVVCSLEPWDEIWRRNQFLVDALISRNPKLSVLFVEPPEDAVLALAHGRLPKFTGRRSIGERLIAFRPVKPLPRRLGPAADRFLLFQVRRGVRAVGFHRPVLWVNDLTYAPLIRETGWPSVYDVTDDWLLAAAPERELTRLEQLEAIALRDADEVVVCSPQLAASRGRHRAVSLVRNGVDVARFREPRSRPPDLPPAPTAVYVGTLHDERLDVELVLELLTALGTLHVVLVGPDALKGASRRALERAGATLLGPRPHDAVPAYLQYADVVIVPHRTTPFTESLDPIKAYECLAVGRATVATDIAGFRGLNANIAVVPRAEFAEAVARTLATTPTQSPAPDGISWTARCDEFETVLLRALRART
jgi:teichuronic acid biosynthesis glycosyltransferase TuaH